MSGDARFEDAGEGPLRLKAETAEDLTVISALVQDAVTTVGDVAFAQRHHRLALLVNRFRWEDRVAAERAGRAYERVRSLLVVESALSVRSNGLDRSAKDTVLSVLSLAFEPAEEGAGTLTLLLAGDGEIAVTVECLDVSLTDVTRPYVAPSGKAPGHGD
ncbi:DUF2948 family protein [Paroceanicella profunda]|uniref:DUF2948 family protein n=1 Tax=Paroceanicella profunda TaxID=2579971 RepID=A0A5B8FWE4_9RHOB|nr:DUF2948 family protein [Paroceanicella profunda]QDL91824.1 DUF2948 family protein [Paroceanicella profunda]